MDAFAKIRLEAIFSSRKVPPADLVEICDYSITVKRDEGLGLELKNLMVIVICYHSPCTGIVKVGDVLLTLNGMPITSHEKFGKMMQAACSAQYLTKLAIRVLRLKRHIPRPVAFPVIPKREGFVTDTLVLYNLKGYFHLGLDIKELDGKLIVCDFVDNSLADITFSLGEGIVDVDGEKVATCTAFNDRVRKSLEIRNFCLITVEVPLTDPLKNLLRSQISKVVREGGKTSKMQPDVVVYLNEGINVFRRFSNDPLKSVWAGERTVKYGSERASHLKMEDRVKETDVPTEWNTRLFVRIPPMKTFETEALPQ